MHERVCLLGSPIRSNAFCYDFAMKVIEGAISTAKHFERLDDLHMEYILHNRSLTICNLTFLMRTTPPDHIDMTRWRSHISESLQRLLGLAHEPPDEMLVQAGFSVKNGGLGLKWNEDYSVAAYVASVSASKNIVRRLVRNEHWEVTGFEEYVNWLNERTRDEHRLTTAEMATPRKLQKRLCDSLDLSRFDDLTESMPVREVARMRGIAGDTHAGDWPKGTPNRNLFLKFDNREFRSALRYRMGAFLFKKGAECAQCSKRIDRFGDHAVHCKKGGFLTARHNAVQRFFLKYASAAGLNPRKEVLGLTPAAGKNDRPGDICIDIDAGVTVAYDVSIISPLQNAFVKKSAQDPTNVFWEGEQRKHNKYKADENGMIAEKVQLVPLIISTLGAVSDSVVDFVNTIAQELHWKWGYSVGRQKDTGTVDVNDEPQIYE